MRTLILTRDEIDRFIEKAVAIADQPHHRHRGNPPRTAIQRSHHFVGLLVDGLPDRAVRAITQLLDDLVPGGRSA